MSKKTKFLIIPDLHGKQIWKDLVKKIKRDKTIWLGDYLDSFTHTDEELYFNLKDIIDYVNKNKKNNILLLGNHDLPYFLLKENIKIISKVMCPGFRYSMCFKTNELLLNNRKLFLPIYKYKNYLFSHAGISQQYYDLFLDHTKEIDKQINNLFIKRDFNLFARSPQRGGYEKAGGLFWADISELNDPLEGYHQIVGHNMVNDIVKIKKNDKTSIEIIDCLDSKELIYTVEI